MPKTVTASEAKRNLGSLVDWVVSNQDEIIVANHGAPRAAIISFEEYERFQALKEQERRKQILEDLRKLRQEVSARNQDLSEDDAQDLSDRFVHEVVEEMIAEGKLTYGP